jgi:hypothetical protein
MHTRTMQTERLEMTVPKAMGISMMQELEVGRHQNLFGAPPRAHAAIAAMKLLYS